MEGLVLRWGEGKDRKDDTIPVILVWMNGSEVRSPLETANTRIEKHVERQTLWPDGNVQQAADGTGLKIRMRGQLPEPLALTHLLRTGQLSR